MENSYPVLCAWCQAKGVVNEISRASVEDSHGICKECKREELKEYFTTDQKAKDLVKGP